MALTSEAGTDPASLALRSSSEECDSTYRVVYTALAVAIQFKLAEAIEKHQTEIYSMNRVREVVCRCPGLRVRRLR
jgi:hypothetical protein